MNDKLQIPPALILRFFRWFCHPDYVEDIEGDLMERYDRNIKLGRYWRAKWLFLGEVVMLFRPGIIKPIEGTQKLNYYGMIKHNFILTIRNFTRHKNSS